MHCDTFQMYYERKALITNKRLLLIDADQLN